MLTDGDKQLLIAARRDQGGFYLATRWYLNGWEPLPYQYAFHQSLIPNNTFLAGIATGKTTIVAASNVIDCITIPHFQALNTSVTAKQAELPFEMIQSWMANNPKLEHHIDKVSLRPYPVIEFKNSSTYTFRTSGVGGRFIRGHEYDRINYDECGLDFTGETLKVLRGRLRGTRPDGSERMGRLDTTTSPTPAPWFIERFERGDKNNPKADLKSFSSMRITTYMNTKLPPGQIELMEKEYTEEMIRVELMAEFPDYSLSMFPQIHLRACSDASLNDTVELALRPESGKPKTGYRLEEHPRWGVVHYEVPPIPGHSYVMGGDPGTDDYPHRNAPVVVVLDVSVRPFTIVFFAWLAGKGSYLPFLQTYKYCIEKYWPALKGVDITGTQKAIDELAFESMGISIDGLNFNRDKQGMLNSLSMAVTDHNIRWPAIQGIQKQMGSYSREVDDKIPQDITMTLAEVAFLARYMPELEDSVTTVNQVRYLYNRRAAPINRRLRR